MRTLLRTEKHWNGMETRWYWDSADRKLVVQRYQDVKPQLEHNQRQYNDHGDWKAGRYGKGATHKVASIPPAVIEMWMKEGFDVFTCSDEELKRKLNDPDFKRLRTMPGRL